ncbi:Cupredoxin-like domain-containing protein [Modestobacter sp. DSM 44400]|uniref:cupredoxin domain-containing protein n=1 Tax=Modestobacter sp. DSM 44400 TaxID=1550230 RepID=UPI0008957099|nr:cupredoxin domain-containing protein [Modestobacter sp. DSM 44400]SDY73260.1 Cupredoxin-like domain-containing protein [Modestobacter sp. DSM 44400]
MAIRRALVLLVGASPLLLTACGQEPDAAASETAVAVTASDDSCQLDRTDLAAGDVTFAVTNEGSSVTEVYVYGEDDGEFTRVVSEVENIGPATSQDLHASLPAGTYEVACKPGQTGDGIRTTVTVTGEDTGSADSAEEEGYDRAIELATDGTAITGLSGGAEEGEAIEFKLTNNAAEDRVLELKDPTGAVAGEVEVEPGTTGEIIIELDASGTWQVIVEGDGAEDLVSELPVS